MKTEATVTSDCQWVVDQCKRRLKERDKYGAKAWIITARSLYPKDFRVQVCMGMNGDAKHWQCCNITRI